MPKVKVDADICIGCETCQNIDEEVFKVEDGISKVQKGFDYEEHKDKIDESITKCPAGAISLEEDEKE